MVRERLGLTQKELAIALDIDPSAVSRMENYTKQLDCYTLRQLKLKFDVDINWMLIGDEIKTERKCENHIYPVLQDLQIWLSELCEEEPERETWLKYELKDNLPLFNEWLKKRQAESETDNRRCA